MKLLLCHAYIWTRLPQSPLDFDGGFEASLRIVLLSSTQFSNVGIEVQFYAPHKAFGIDYCGLEFAIGDELAACFLGQVISIASFLTMLK